MNVEILAWIDSSVYTEYNGASFKEKYIDHKWSYDHFYSLGLDSRFLKIGVF